MDDREKRPLPFPAYLVVAEPLTFRPRTVSLRTLPRRLPFGDYQLEGTTRCGVVERKQDLDELKTNLTNPHRRENFVEELRQLSSCSHPLLYLEGTPLELSRTREADPASVASLLLAVLSEHHIPLWCVPSSSESARRAGAEWVARHLIYASLASP